MGKWWTGNPISSPTSARIPRVPPTPSGPARARMSAGHEASSLASWPTCAAPTGSEAGGQPAKDRGVQRL
jgi:hypothetical protein